MSLLQTLAEDLLGKPRATTYGDLLKEAAVDGAKRLGYDVLARGLECCDFVVVDNDRVEVTVPATLPMRFRHENVEKALAVHGFNDWPVFVKE